MLFKNITIIDENIEVKKNQYVLVEGKKITYIGDEIPEFDVKEIYDGKNKLLMTGFINSHSHTPMTLMRGYAENLPLDKWLNEKIFPFEDKLDGDDIYRGSMLGIAEMIRFGIVSTTDMYYFCDRAADAFLESGVKCNISRGVVCFDDKSYFDLPAFNENKHLLENYHKKNDGQILIDLSLHAEYTTTEKVCRELLSHARDNGLSVHIHLSETKNETEECKIRHNGKTPAEYFEYIGLFENKTVCAHSVWLSDNDIEILHNNRKNVSIASCPVSNMKLASGMCDVKKLFLKNINIGLGTDSVASNNNLNMIEEMKFFALSAKIKSSDPTAVTPKQAVCAATKAGAIIQGRDDCGALKVGNKADLIVLDIDKPYMKPEHNLLNNLVYSACGADVVLTMADGKILYKDGEYLTLDIEKIVF